MDRKNLLVDVLLDKSAREDERSDAAIDLYQFENLEVIRALVQIASDSKEDIVLIDNCAESLGNILSKGDFYDEKIIGQLVPLAQDIVRDIIMTKNPSLLKNPESN